ncbi:hypothetical protein [Sulfurimonas sp.]|uniref:hypothetical protein n=1 Tax=Sulfurimonas sp. TaxID=2022749 RepID=UPI0025F5A41A|nr:hypothetical protein [Sulfurimonas sp.]MBT5935183.1 hypothetical protein [Sulfurimonas sp.]
MKKMSQNIFDYATSELSQDAFISLMVSWYDNTEDSILKKLSIDFITQLYDGYNDLFLNNELPILEITSIKIIQQHHKIDVYFEVTDKNGDIIPFIIEDKTWTEPHSNQLQRYNDKIKSHSIKIFFKTGHLTEKDQKLTYEAQYMILDAKWIYDFLKPYINKTSNVILHNFFDYLTREFYNKLYTESGNKKTLHDWDCNDLKEGFVQYELIKSIKNIILKPNENLIRYTKNGKLWDTWWTFLNIEKKTQFFIKIKRIGKKGNESYRLRLIEYSTSTDKQMNSEICGNIITSLSDTDIKLTKNPRFKAKETEIAYLEMCDGELEKYADDFAIFIQKFIEKSNGI